MLTVKSEKGIVKLNRKLNDIYVCNFKNWRDTVWNMLEMAELISALKGHKRVIIKPNLVSSQPPPITTPVEIIESIVEYIQIKLPGIKIMAGEGSGSVSETTMTIFEKLGYLSMAMRKNIELIDLNDAPLVHLKNESCHKWSEMFLPRVVMDSFLISVPVLKAHSLAGVTLTMKNMIGVCPPACYQSGSNWKKSAFHNRVHHAVFDLNQYRSPDFSLIDATVGMKAAHMWGPVCDPKPNLIIAGYDPVAVDAYAAGVIRKKWEEIGHIALSNRVLGQADPLNVIRI